MATLRIAAKRFLEDLLLTLTQPAARALMTAALGLDRRPPRPAVKADVLAAIRRLGALQIDTIHVVARSPYLALFSRLGHYDARWLDALLAEGALFEYWSHEASFLPIEDFPLYRHRMLAAHTLGWRYSQEWLEAHQAEIQHVRERIHSEGPLRAADFTRKGGPGNGWWDWKPEKIALETLFARGELMIARRHNFQRVYDLRERVLPGWDDSRAPSPEEAQRLLLCRAVRALGVATALWAAEYFRIRKEEALPLLPALAAEGRLLAVQVEGWDEPAYLHPERLSLAEAAAAGALRPELTTLLSPFDPLVANRQRASTVFGFDFALECYLPATKRRYGYFTLPVLRRGELIGRLDPKAHRKEGLFEVKMLYLEPGVPADEALVADLAQAIAECARWHGTPQVAVRASDPPDLAARVEQAISG